MEKQIYRDIAARAGGGCKVAVVGPPACGRHTAARALAASLGAEYGEDGSFSLQEGVSVAVGDADALAGCGAGHPRHVRRLLRRAFTGGDRRGRRGDRRKAEGGGGAVYRPRQQRRPRVGWLPRRFSGVGESAPSPRTRRKGWTRTRFSPACCSLSRPCGWTSSCPIGWARCPRTASSPPTSSRGCAPPRRTSIPCAGALPSARRLRTATSNLSRARRTPRRAARAAASPPRRAPSTASSPKSAAKRSAAICS